MGIMTLTVIIPCHGRADLLKLCLSSLRNSSLPPAECIVVDDGSPAPDAGEISRLTAAHGAILLRQAQAGPAAARNLGAQQASGQVLVFFDSDVIPHTDTLERLAAALRDPEIAAVFGSYDDQPVARTLVSDYRNLLHHHVHQNSQREASTFWAGCGAIRRNVFLRAGGFAASYQRPSIEDVEFGLRLTASGHRIQLDPSIQVCHAKRWNLRSMIQADIFQRAIPWTCLLLDRGDALPRDLNFRLPQRLSVAFAALVLSTLPFAVALPKYWLPFALSLCAAICWLNRPFLDFLWRRRGWRFAVLAAPLHFAHLASSAVGFLGGALLTWHRRDPRAWQAALFLFAGLLGIQLAVGAYAADFSGHPDEPSHYVTGVMVSQFLQRPTASPMSFAEQYYLHYPKVSIGHWPPLLYALEGFWFILFGVSRTAALALQLLVAWMLAIMVYALGRQWSSATASAAAAGLLVISLPFQQSLGSVMADSLTALFVVGAGVALISYWERPRFWSGQLFGLCAAFALLTKGTACPLVALPVLAVLLARRWEMFRRLDFWSCGLPVLLLAAPWYLFAVSFQTPNRSAFQSGDPAWLALGATYGWPLPAAAALGAYFVWRRNPPAIVLIALALAYVLAPFGVKAFQEGRHLLPAAAAAAVLAAAAIDRLPLKAVGAAILFLLSWPGLFTRPPAVFRPWASSAKLTGPLLVTGSGFTEGAAVAALAERYPDPLYPVYRASRVLAVSTWSGNGYRTLFAEPAAVKRRIETLGVTKVLMPHEARLPHDEMLIAATATWPRTQTAGYRLLMNPRPVPAQAGEIYQRRLGRTIRIESR
jgi:GT2 family glycosyltransferase